MGNFLPLSSNKLIFKFRNFVISPIIFTQRSSIDCGRIFAIMICNRLTQSHTQSSTLVNLLIPPLILLEKVYFDSMERNSAHLYPPHFLHICQWFKRTILQLVDAWTDKIEVILTLPVLKRTWTCIYHKGLNESKMNFFLKYCNTPTV